MNTLEDIIDKMERYIPESAYSNVNVSQGSVGWHISHSLLTVNVITDALLNSNPTEYKWTFNWKRLFVFAINRIPRGKIKAPTVVQPKNNFDMETLVRFFLLTKEKVKALDNLKPHNFFNHPFLGKIKLHYARKFMKIHTKHHLNIIEDIIQSR